MTMPELRAPNRRDDRGGGAADETGPARRCPRRHRSPSGSLVGASAEWGACALVGGVRGASDRRRAIGFPVLAYLLWLVGYWHYAHRHGIYTSSPAGHVFSRWGPRASTCLDVRTIVVMSGPPNCGRSDE
jgi:hypothetical protein